MIYDCFAIVLAAGEGKRMKSTLPKVMHNAAGKPIAAWIIEAAAEATGQKPVLVTGNGAEIVKEYFGDNVRYAVQKEQLGTGHAVMAAKEYLGGEGYVLVAAGDMPLLRSETLSKIIEAAVSEELGVCLLSAVLDNASGYGRIVRTGTGLRIVEHKDATEQELLINEINTSVYCFKKQALLEALDTLKNDNSQKEYYLTDCVGYISQKGWGAKAVVCDDAEECMGVNDRAQLAAVSKTLRRRINSKLMLEGATIIDPGNTYIDAGVKVGLDAVIYPGVTLEGKTVIAEGVTIYPGSRIQNSVIGKGTKVHNSVIIDSRVGDNSTVGPYAYLQPGSVAGGGCHVNGFNEVKDSFIEGCAKKRRNE